MSLETWREVLKPGDTTPVFAKTLQALRDLLPRREEVTAREVASVVLADPLATLQLLHSLNKRVMERYGTEVPTVEGALMMLGLGVYLDAARRLTLVENTQTGKDPHVQRALYALARRAQHAAWQAHDFAVLHTDVRAEEVRVAALLAFAPEMLLWLRRPEIAAAVRRARRSAPNADPLRTVLGTPAHPLRVRVLEDWSLPPLTLDLLGDDNAARARQSIINACVEIATRADRGWWDEQLLTAYVSLAGVENTPVEDIIAITHANAARVARQSDWLTTPPAAAWGPMLEGVWPTDEVDDEINALSVQRSASAPPQTAPTPAPAATAPTATPEAEGEICPMPDKAVLRGALQNIESHLDGTLTLNQMSAVILKGLHTGLGLSRILFAMVTPDGHRVKARFTLGMPADDPLRHFEFVLGGSDLFNQLMGKMQGLWINPENREKLWPMISPALQKQIGPNDFFAMSLFADNKPLGLIYADRGHGECALDPHAYTDFKMLCLQAARGLGKVKV